MSSSVGSASATASGAAQAGQNPGRALDSGGKQLPSDGSMAWEDLCLPGGEQRTLWLMRDLQSGGATLVEVLPGGRHSLLTEQEFVDKYSKSAIVAELRRSIDDLGSVIALLGVERAAAKAASARNIAGSEAAIALSQQSLQDSQTQLVSLQFWQLKDEKKYEQAEARLEEMTAATAAVATARRFNVNAGGGHLGMTVVARVGLLCLRTFTLITTTPSTAPSARLAAKA